MADGGEWGEERPSGREREGSGRGGEARPAPGDQDGSEAAAAAAGKSPDLPHNIMDKFELEAMVHKLWEDLISRLSAENKSWNQKVVEEISHLSEEIRQLKQKVEQSEENKQLKDQLIQLNNKRDEEVNFLKQELKKAQDKQSWSFGFRGGKNPTKDFQVQVRIAGITGGCEEMFLEEVKERLSQLTVSLKVKQFTKASKDLLLIFCPIASRMGTDIENALKGLSDMQKAILVVMHFVQMDNMGPLVEARQKVVHSPMVQTVHTRYTLQDGLYPCKMNEEAVGKVAAAIQDLAEDPPKPSSSIISSPGRCV